MIYEIFEVEGYARLGLNSIKRIRLEMSEIIQVILGRNGSGKSSLLAELNPFPADSKFFNSNGHKLVVIRKGTDQYRLKSTFKPSPKHSFIINDGEELNPGGTATVQKDLVKQYFGLTTDILGVIVGTEKFTGMTGQRRRELLTMMCDTDYDYAIKVYNRVTGALRDTTGALRIAKKRLAAEVANIFTDEEFKAAQEQLNVLTQKSQELYQLKDTNAPDKDTAFQRVRALETRIKEIAKKFWDIRRTLLINDTWTPSEIQYDIDMLRERLAASIALMQSNVEQYDVIQKRIADSGAVDDSEYIRLTEQAASLVSIIETYRKRIKTTVDVLNPQEATLTCDRVKESLMEALINLPNNESRWYTHDKFAQQSEMLTIAQQTTHAIKEEQRRIEHYVERMEEAKRHSEVECPSCEHKFLPGFSEEKYQELLKAKSVVAENLKSHEAKLAEITECYDTMMEYRKARETLRNIIVSSDAIAGFWGTALDEDTLCQSPMLVFTRFEHFHSDVRTMIKIAEHNQELKSVQFRIENANNARKRDIEQDKRELIRLDEAVLVAVNEQRTINEKLASAATYQRHVKMMLEVEGVMSKLKGELNDAVAAGSAAIINGLVDEALVTTHADIAVISSKLSAMNARLNLIADIRAQIANLQDDEQAYKLIANTLSPTDGLIAEGLLGFIRAYVKAVNKIIKKFWTYRMEVKDCSTEDNAADLNYKFPLDVEGDKLARNDIKDGSSGMREAIDLAFRFVAMHYTGQSDYPLFLDEFGAFFDAEHKHRAPYAIKAVIDQMQFSQVFIISHHEMEYSAFPNAQFCVLDKKNILLSSDIKYNEHVTIE